MEEITLPKPARTLWQRAREVIHSLPAEDTGRIVVPHIGGGTLLAARWKHRLSADIDILLPGRNSLIRFAQDNDDNLARRLGGEPEAQTGSRIKIAFEHGKLDISVLRPSPARAERQASVDGVGEMVLSSAQVLRGKLERVMKLPVRDVIDMTVAGKKDPGALATAANMLSRDAAGAVAELWRAADEEFEKQLNEDNAVRSLNVPGGVNEKTLGTAAAQALMDNRYRRLRVEVENDRLRIRRWGAAGPLPSDEYDRNRAAEALIESGIGIHLNQNGPIDAPGLLKAIRVAGERGRRVVYDSSDSKCLALAMYASNSIEPAPRPAAATGTADETTRPTGQTRY